MRVADRRKTIQGCGPGCDVVGLVDGIGSMEFRGWI